MRTKLGKSLLVALLVLGLMAPVYDQGVTPPVQPAGPKPGTTGWGVGPGVVLV
jgi:hypothetical protein